MIFVSTLPRDDGNAIKFLGGVLISMRKSIGVDIGGTKMNFAILNEDGSLENKFRISTPAFSPRDEFMNILKANIRDMLGRYDVCGIGVGVPGLQDVERGVAIYAGNCPALKGTPVVEILQEEFKIPVYIDNDVRVATLGEFWYGAGKDANTIICVTLGTGIGSGIIIRGKLWRGSNCAAGEIGHVKLKEDWLSSTLDMDGTLEAISSGPAIATAYHKMVEGEKLEGRVDTSLKASEVAERAHDGDKTALEIFQTAGYYLGIAIAGYVNLINPELVIIGGGLASVGDLLLKPAFEAYQRYALDVSKQVCRITMAQLGNDAGVVGAGAMVFHYLDGDKFWL